MNVDPQSTTLWGWIDRVEKARFQEILDEAEKNKKSDSGGCFITTACIRSLRLSSDCEELTTMRTFRDEYILSTPTGCAEVSEYYAVAPLIVEAIQESGHSDAIYDSIFHKMLLPVVDLIRANKYGDAHSFCRYCFMFLSKTFVKKF